MKKLNNKGFSAIEIIMALVIVALLGLAGWMVYSRSKHTTKSTVTTTTSTQPQTTKAATTTAAPDPTADWITYTNKDAPYTLKYPKTWATAPNAAQCSSDIFMLGADAASVGRCASDFGGQMEVIIDANPKADYSLGANYPDAQSASVTVNGVTGSKLTGTYKSAGSEQALGGLKDGTKIVRYTFVNNGKTYVLQYYSASETADYPDALTDFNTMVTKTLQFKV